MTVLSTVTTALVHSDWMTGGSKCQLLTHSTVLSEPQTTGGGDIDILTMGLIFPWTYLWAPGALPGGKLVWGILLAMVVEIPVAFVYVWLSTALPRSGGDYVFQSRVFGGGLAFTVVMSGFVIWILQWVALSGWLLSYLGFAPLFLGLIALMGVDAETGVFMLLYLDLAYEQAKREGRLRNLADLQDVIRYGAAGLQPALAMAATGIVGVGLYKVLKHRLVRERPYITFAAIHAVLGRPDLLLVNPTGFTRYDLAQWTGALPSGTDHIVFFTDTRAGQFYNRRRMHHIFQLPVMLIF